MLKNFLKTTYLMFHQLKIVHSIPGRLRLFVPGLSNIPEEMRKHEYYTTDLILSKEGIQSIEYSYLTNKVLIHYDEKVIQDKEIVSWLNAVWKIIVDHSDLYEKMTLREIEKNLDRFYELLKKELRRGDL
ncbi:Cation transporter [Fusobacterium necrophorum subsp. funduliforme]|uniref:HMA2 domain-containing protein n=1 Tax=Fusobacterium necrophorum TaxID=859 RepID=UPI00370EAD60